MSEKEKYEPHRIDRGPVHPAVAMAAQMALTVYANWTGPITAEQFERLFNEVAVQGHWAELNVNMRTVALMMATALQFGALLEQNAGLLAAESAADPIAAQASEHANSAMETVASLSALADQFGGGPRA